MSFHTTKQESAKCIWYLTDLVVTASILRSTSKPDDTVIKQSRNMSIIILMLRNSDIPPCWPEILECPTCKRTMVEAIGLCFLQTTTHTLIQGDQCLIMAGCFNSDCVWLIRAGMLPEKATFFASNAVEADYRIWRHAVQTTANIILINSPDTDIYNIGLGIPSDNKEYIIQLNVHHSMEKKYFNLNNFKLAIHRDPDLNHLQREHLYLIVQSLYVSTGCDYLSYIKSFRKATIITVFMQYTTFIDGVNSLGSLHKTQLSNRDDGFLAFLRLVGCCYFKKHLAAFVSNYGFSTPIQLYNFTEASLVPSQRHQVCMATKNQTSSFKQNNT